MLYNQLEVGEIQVYQRRQKYVDKYTFKPPPYFMISISVIQLFVFFFYLIKNGSNEAYQLDTIFIFNGELKSQVWRYLTYCLVHLGWDHFDFNLIFQLFVGIPLEMVHGSARISLIYLSAVLASSLTFAIFHPSTYLIGSSAGIYSLLTCHLADVYLNKDLMESEGKLRILGVLSIIILELLNSIFLHAYIYKTISYTSHFVGAIVGFTLGIVVLKDFVEEETNFLIKKILLCCNIFVLIFEIIFNILDK